MDRRAKDMKTEPGEQPKNEKNKCNSPEHHTIIVRDCVAGCLSDRASARPKHICSSLRTDVLLHVPNIALRGQKGDVRKHVPPKDGHVALGKATFSATVSQF